MDYISVKDAAIKFALSERRIQKLCETQRIDGCKMVSGVWLIPSNVTKPSDERLGDFPVNDNYISLKELCEELSISTATGRNWIKLGKLIPEYTEKRTPFFTKDYLVSLKSEIQSGQNTALKSRRNKKYVSGNALYNSYVSENCKNIIILQKILGLATENNIEFTLENTQYILADCALHLFITKTGAAAPKSLFLKYLNNEIDFGNYNILIDALIEDRKDAITFCQRYPMLFNLEYSYESNEDVLGLIYISCKNIGNRKATGSYYTPTKVVKKLISRLDIAADKKIIDPCCGTGNFLLQLPENINYENIYGTDIDPVSIKITRLNMALKYPEADIKKICDQITELNYLSEYTVRNFDYIIGNPPWGYNFSKEEKHSLKTIYKSASGKNIESFDVFIERALSNLVPGGQLSFVLPEAILNVKAHSDIRSVILDRSSIKYLEFLGNAFDGVNCPCIILQLAYTGTSLSTAGMVVNEARREFMISTKRNVSPEYFSFKTNDKEYMVLEKIKNMDNITYLAGNADFALGIVTGNNKEYISAEKSDNNEMVLKGADISKYHINQTNNYIIFNPEKFQQVAPTEMYRAPEKLLYRFICNQLVFAYDDKQTLSLNSCNIVIPKLAGVKMKYILAILNSRIAQFIYKKEFNSVKVLRSHIENIPIPIVNERAQDKIIAITDLLIKGQNNNTVMELYDQLDNMIFELFHLSPDDQQTIKLAVDGDNKFLS